MSTRVAFVMPGVGVVERGAEAFVVELARGLARTSDFDITLLCRGQAAVPHRRIRALPRDSAFVNAVYGATRVGRKVFDTLFLDPLNIEWASAALAAFPSLWRGGFDLVVMEGGLLGARLCRLLRALRGVPFIDIAHGNSPKWEGAFARQNPDRVVAFTQAAAGMIRQRAPRARVEIIPHGVDLERFRPGGEPVELSLEQPRVITAGTVEQHKQMHLTVNAMARLGRGSLLVLGDGPAASALDRLAGERLGRDRYQRVRVPRHDLPAWYAAADCFTLPSRTESFGLVYLEAMACGLPSVAPDDGVRREVIGEAGTFFALQDEAAYARALEVTLDRSWADLPRRRAEKFPLSATIQAYARLFSEVAA